MEIIGEPTNKTRSSIREGDNKEHQFTLKIVYLLYVMGHVRIL